MAFGFGKGRMRGSRGRGFRRGSKRKGFEAGGRPATCICPKCRLSIPHQPGIPCFQTRCSRCGSTMTRRFFVEE